MEESWFSDAGRAVAVHIDLDALSNNVQLLRSLCQNVNAGIVAMVKANAYGHGSQLLSRHLQDVGVERFGVASIGEGVELRMAGIFRPIHVMGNILKREMTECVKYNLIPTVTSLDGVDGMVAAQKNLTCEFDVQNDQLPMETIRRSREIKPTCIHLKIDTGMSRNGCLPEDLPRLIQACDDNGVTIDGIYTHFADYENQDFTKGQLDTFYSAIAEYRDRDFLFHVANSGAIINNFGTDLDLVRPGIALYGLPPGTELDTMSNLGFKPIASVHGHATLVKCLPADRSIGYGCTYKTKSEEWIATIPIGYGDGYPRALGNKAVVVRSDTGEHCQVVGRVSMDSITIRLPGPVSDDESFTLVTADYDHETSTSALAMLLNTITYEITTRLMPRLPRVYTKCGKVFAIHKLSSNIQYASK